LVGPNSQAHRHHGYELVLHRKSDDRYQVIIFDPKGNRIRASVRAPCRSKWTSVEARAGCHRGFVESRLNDGQLKVTVISIPGTVSFFQEALGRSVPE
jgi:hypothetical protein